MHVSSACVLFHPCLNFLIYPSPPILLISTDEENNIRYRKKGSVDTTYFTGDRTEDAEVEEEVIQISTTNDRFSTLSKEYSLTTLRFLSFYLYSCNGPRFTE